MQKVEIFDPVALVRIRRAEMSPLLDQAMAEMAQAKDALSVAMGHVAKLEVGISTYDAWLAKNDLPPKVPPK